MHYKKFLALLISLFLFSGCAPQQALELGSVDDPSQGIVVGSISQPGEYTLEGAKGLYSNCTAGNRLVTFLGLRNHKPSTEQQESIPEGYKPVITAFSVETLPSGDRASITSSGIRLVHIPSSLLYAARWNMDADLEMEDEKIAGTVACMRLVYLIPEDTDIEDYLVTFTHDLLPESLRFSSLAPQADVAGTAIDYVNMCPLCQSAEYKYDELNIGTCEMCDRKFTSGHAPCQRICFSCSVINNYCTQCMRYIEKNNATIFKKN